MPFYEYECRKCGFRFEELIALSERDEAEARLRCPTCGAERPRRLLSSFATANPSPAPPSCGAGG